LKKARALQIIELAINYINKKMGLFSFIKSAGSKLFGKKELEAPKEEVPKLQASALLNHVNKLGSSLQKLEFIPNWDKSDCIRGS
jgi:hypothetical protein